MSGTEMIFPSPEAVPLMERNPMNRRQYSVFRRDAVLSKLRASEMYDAASAVAVITDMLLIANEERAHAEDESPDAAPLNQRNEWGLLCALRVCANVLHSEMSSIKEKDGYSSGKGSGGT